MKLYFVDERKERYARLKEKERMYMMMVSSTRWLRKITREKQHCNEQIICAYIVRVYVYTTYVNGWIHLIQISWRTRTNEPENCLVAMSLTLKYVYIHLYL